MPILDHEKLRERARLLRDAYASFNAIEPEVDLP